MWKVSAIFGAVLVGGSTLAQMAQLPAGPMQQKATTACTECHSALIIVQQRLSPSAWNKEVDKMVKWGALVDPKDRDALVQYLCSSFPAGKAPYGPPRNQRVNKRKR
jgi:hypothetical protein